ncbi:hypothetical protein [Bradyrhizobium diazoefficiens]|uniref:hypothetical protein n=1 Tax=Bradyrhizobium diazoefficiens TaxID=1355477 RepID=UPI00272CEB9F|nr:hypothetical protein [Bradyrhizobium diazoefficiens]WLA68065.1 hypothetical protein QNN01_16190 [Bradyrhizobium diazoefficiens]
MTYSLTWLPGVLHDARLEVLEQPGWQTRGHGDMGEARDATSCIRRSMRCTKRRRDPRLLLLIPTCDQHHRCRASSLPPLLLRRQSGSESCIVRGRRQT